MQTGTGIILLFGRNRSSSGGVHQPNPTGRPSQSANAEEIEQRKKLADRARRFAAPPPAKAQSGVVKLGTKRPSNQGLETDSQSTAKQMRLLASRKVVAKARATAVQQRQGMMQQRQQQPQQLKPVQTTPQSSASTAPQPAAVQRIPASQRLGIQSVKQQPVASGQKTAPPSVPNQTRPISDVCYLR